METLLQAENLRAHYRTAGGRQIRAVDGVSLSLQAGEVLGIAGESGCGKSTLAAVLAWQVLPPLVLDGGSLAVEGRDPAQVSPDALRREVRGKLISVVPQGAMNSLNPTARVGSLAVDMMREHFPDMPRKQAWARAGERARALGLDPEVLRLYPHQLSGGMKQRAVILISTLLNPRVLIADEPTSALDVSSQKGVLQLLLQLLREGIIGSIVFITHELPLLRHVADRVAIMYAGRLVEVGSMEQVLFSPEHPYTRALMASVLVAEPGARQRAIESIPGIPPDLGAPPAGCRFHPRCSAAIERCRSEEPPEREAFGRKSWCWLEGQAS